LCVANVWLLFCVNCICWCVWMTVSLWVSFLNVVFWSINSALCVPFRKCSVSVHSTHLWCTIWKVFCFCAQYSFLMYCLQCVLFLCTVHISDCRLGSVLFSVHSTHFWSLILWYLCNRFLVQVFCFSHPSSLFYSAEDSSNPCLTCHLILVSLWKCPIRNLRLTSAITVQYEAFG